MYAGEERFHRDNVYRSAPRPLVNRRKRPAAVMAREVYITCGRILLCGSGGERQSVIVCCCGHELTTPGLVLCVNFFVVFVVFFKSRLY